MISVKNLTIETLKGRKLIENLSFNLNDGDKMAVIGEEGNGKSTLIKAIIDPSLVSDYCEVTGSVNLNNSTIGYLEQRLDLGWNDFTVLEYFLKPSLDSDVDYSLYNQINEIEKILRKLNFNVNHLNNEALISTLSGGEKVKIQLAKLRIMSPDVIFLDEPTNDLDIETLEKLESFILSTKAPIMYISHDETLLENTANIILHIEQLIKKTKPKYTLKKCSYSEYVESRKRAIEHQTQIAYNERRERDKKEEILRQMKQKVENALVGAKKDPSSGRIIAKKMANVKALERRYDNEELTEIPDVEEAIKLIVDENITIPSQKIVLDLNLDELKVDNLVLANNINLKVVGPERIAIIGNNGCGKTTLIKTIVPILQQVKGIKVGYFSQNYFEILDYNKSAVDELSYCIDFGYNPRTLLGSLKFTRDEMEHKIMNLSEGQKAKIALCKLIIEKNNVLVLDEPTRNLSPLSNPVIREMLNNFHGAIIAVSHDRKFISNVCDTVYSLDKSGLTKIPMCKLSSEQSY